jgi:hypothetical protein
MFFFFKNELYSGESAVEILRKIESDSKEYLRNGASIRDFLAWSLEGLGDRVPIRELLLTDSLSDETLALSYLCLLDQYGLGELDTSPHAARHALD